MDLAMQNGVPNDIEYINEAIEEDIPDLNPEMFISFYNEDKLGGMIRNLDVWLKEYFEHFKGYKI